MSILPWVPAPMMYRSAFGCLRIWRIANGMRRSSPVKTNMLSFGSMVSQRFGVLDLNIIPPMTNSESITKDGVNIRRSIFLAVF